MSQDTVRILLMRLAAAPDPLRLADALPDASPDQRARAATLAKTAGLARVEGEGRSSRWTLTEMGRAGARAEASRGGGRLGGH